VQRMLQQGGVRKVQARSMGAGQSVHSATSMELGKVRSMGIAKKKQGGCEAWNRFEEAMSEIKKSSNAENRSQYCYSKGR
jgi:hypothetical protein